MKSNDKIALFALPAGLDSALRHGVGNGYDTRSITGHDTDIIWHDFDLMIATENTTTKIHPWPGLPVFYLSNTQKIRMNNLRRQIGQTIKDPALYIDDFNIQNTPFAVSDKTLRLENGDVTLTEKETDILCFLAKNHQRVCHKNDLLAKVWRYQPDIDTHTLETHIYRLRQKMGALADCLTTDQDGGYRLLLD